MVDTLVSKASGRNPVSVRIRVSVQIIGAYVKVTTGTPNPGVAGSIPVALANEPKVLGYPFMMELG